MTTFFDNPLIYLITDGRATAENFSEKSIEILRLLEIAVERKINLIQIREKKLPARLLFELASKASKITVNSQTRLLVNDRVDVALAAKADGVHLTSVSMPAKVIRQYFPQNLIIGVSAHTPAEAAAAKDQGADFVTFSPIFSTPSKEKYLKPQGLEKLREVCRRLKNFPVIALGGIDESNYLEAIKSGARGIAGIRFLNDEKNLRKLTLNLQGS